MRVPPIEIGAGYMIPLKTINFNHMKLIIVLLSFFIIHNTNINTQIKDNTYYHSKGNLQKSYVDGSDSSMISYSPAPAKPMRVIFDYYHHSLPSTKVGNLITTGSWVDDKGRYGWDDFVHTNTFDPVYVALEKDYQISMSREPFSSGLKANTDIVVIINNEDPASEPSANLISDKEITVLRQFVEEGGSLMVMINAGSPDRQNEGFEKVQLRKLVRGFGLDWNDNDTHYSDNHIPEGHPYFYDIPNFHYGAGCTLEILPEANSPEVLLNVYSDPSYTDRHVSGPGIVMVRPGKGKFILVGDRGSWTGNMARPWADNGRFLKQLFFYLNPDRGVKPPLLSSGRSLEYEVSVAGLQAVPVANSLSEVSKPYYRLFSPRPITNMPYFERTAHLQLTCEGHSDGDGSKISASISDFKWFDEQPADSNDQVIDFTVSRQGKVSGIETTGYDAQWLAPDLPLLIALLPVDGLRPGDRWNSEEPLRVPILRGSDLPPVKKHNFELVYVRDTQVDGKDCRLIRSSDEIWLDELGIKVEELLPQELVRQAGGSNYRYFTGHGGKLLFKREQWVDHKTGIVLKARAQIRVIAWIHDLRKPVPEKNADKDNEMIVSLAHIVNFQLKGL